MNRLISITFAILFIVIATSGADARPKKGFHTGPYLALQVGIMQADFDHDEVEGKSVGRSIEPAFGFMFGWNIKDYFSAEIQGRYATDLNSGQREHIAAGYLSARYTFIADFLTDFKTLRILPFLKAGPATRISALPNTPQSSGGTVTSYGIGPSFGGGIMFLCRKYLYFGVDLAEDLLFFNDINQTVNGVPGVNVYKGGFKPSFNALATIGVHY